MKESITSGPRKKSLLTTLALACPGLPVPRAPRRPDAAAPAAGTPVDPAAAPPPPVVVAGAGAGAVAAAARRLHRRPRCRRRLGAARRRRAPEGTLTR